MSTEEQSSVFQQLWDRKFPQYLGTYLAVGFGLLQFLEFVTKRYGLSNSFVDKYLLVWIIILPAVATLIYFKGQLTPRTEDGTIKWPKMVVIGNFIIAIFLGGFMFNGSGEVSANDSETITLMNEEGKEITAVVPSLNKVQSIASFSFENLTGEEDEDWWGPAFSDLLMLDLEQRPEFYVKSEFHLSDHYDGLGLESFKLPSVGMQREIAQKSRSNYFTRISYAKENNEFVLSGNLYSSRDGSSVMEINAVDTDPFKAIEKLKQQIVENIPDGLETLENQISLPTSSLLTSNVEALKYYTQAQIVFAKDANNIQEYKRLGEEAIGEDPTCSHCHLNVAMGHYLLGERDDAIKSIKTSIKYGASLPERMQFMSKEILYSITQNIDAYWKLLEVKKNMFPYEFSSYQSLLGKYRVDYGVDSAKMLMNEAIENGNIERGLLALYDLQLQDEEYAEAEKTLDRFSSEFPDREQDRLKYADIYVRQGKIAEAKKILIDAEALDPLSTIIQTKIAYVDFKNLDFDAASNRLNQGIAQATTLTDSLTFFRAKEFTLRARGQMEDAMNVLEDYEEYSKKRINTLRLISTFIYSKADIYQSTSNSHKVKDLLEEIGKYSPEDVSQYECMSNTQSVVNDFEPIMTSERYANCHDVYQKFGDGYAEFFDVLISYEKGDYANCVKVLDAEDERIMKLFQKDLISKIYFKGGERDKAKEILQKAIDQKPYTPNYYYLMAEILESEGDSQAKDYLDIAMKYWENADEDFIPAQRALALAEKLN